MSSTDRQLEIKRIFAQLELLTAQQRETFLRWVDDEELEDEAADYEPAFVPAVSDAADATR